MWQSLAGLSCQARMGPGRRSPARSGPWEVEGGSAAPYSVLLCLLSPMRFLLQDPPSEVSPPIPGSFSSLLQQGPPPKSITQGHDVL